MYADVFCGGNNWSRNTHKIKINKFLFRPGLLLNSCALLLLMSKCAERNKESVTLFLSFYCPLSNYQKFVPSGFRKLATSLFSADEKQQKINSEQVPKYTPTPTCLYLIPYFQSFRSVLIFIFIGEVQQKNMPLLLNS